MRGAGERRHRDVAMSDFRGEGVTGMLRCRTLVGEASQGRREVGLSWERRHRDVAMSDFRGRAVTGTHRARVTGPPRGASGARRAGGRTFMTIVSGSLHTSAGSLTKMPGTSHFPALRGPFRAEIRGPGTRCVD